MAEIGEVHAVCDLRDRALAVKQVALGALDATQSHKLVGRHAGGAFESAREVKRAEARYFGELLQCDRRGEVRLDICIQTVTLDPSCGASQAYSERMPGHCSADCN